jgi:hypothetical protein
LPLDVTRLFRVAALLCTGLAAASTPASADYIITPFAGKTFGAQSALQTAEGVQTQKWIFGGSAAWLSTNVLGAELDLGYAPRFFDQGQLLNTGSNVTTLTGNVIVAVPLSVSRESLRPYLTAGMGLLHAGADDLLSAAAVDRNLLAVSIGGGAIGFLTPRAGVRFDLRRIRSVSSGVDTTGENAPRLGFWRATVGVALRY